MNPTEAQKHSPLEDELAPTDWSYVRTVEEGVRRQKAQMASRQNERFRTSYRVVPDTASQEGSSGAVQRVSPTVPENSPFVMPESARKPVAADQAPDTVPAKAAAPSPTETVQKAEENPVAGSAPKPERTRRRRQSVPQASPAPETPAPPERLSVPEQPAARELPEWYRVAQANQTPDSIRRPPAPRTPFVSPSEEQSAGKQLYGYAPAQERRPLRQADIYAEGGYPPELLEEQRRIDAELELQQLRKRRGAMAALPEEPKQAALPGNRSYPPSRDDLYQRAPLSPAEQALRANAVERSLQSSASANSMSAPEAVDTERRPFPWLGMVTSLMLILAVFLRLNHFTTARELQKVYAARQEAAQQVADEHPYQYRELIEAQAEQYNLHPAFVASIVLNESSFRPQVKSSADAMGLMQIRPDTGDYINRALDVPNYNHDMLYDPETNIRFGCYYLGELSNRFAGDPVLVAAAYNAGPTNVQNWLNNSLYSADRRTIPLDNIPYGDTQTYARRVLRDFAAYKRLYYETTEGEL